MPITALPSDVLSRPRLVDSNPEVAAHAERVLTLVRGLADARRARAGLRQTPLVVPVPTKLTDLPSEVLSLVLAQLRLVRDIKKARVCRALRAAAPEAEKAHRRVCFEHSRPVRCVAAAPDGRVITGSDDETVTVWRDGACEGTFQEEDARGHRFSVMAVAALPGGARFVSASYDGIAKLRTLDGALERTFWVETQVYCVAALPDGVHFVVGIGNYFHDGDEGEVRLYHVDGTLVHTFTGRISHNPNSPHYFRTTGHTDAVWAVAVTPDGRHIISGAGDTLVKVWSVANKSLVSTCYGHTRSIRAVAAMPDSQRILSGGGLHDHTVRVWLLDGTLENTFELHTNWVHALVALPDNQHALAGSGDATVKLFNVNDGAVLRIFRHHTDSVKCLALLPDGLRFVSGSEDKTARIVKHGLALNSN